MTVLLILLASFPVRIAVFGDRTGSPDDVEFEIAINAIVEMSPDIVLSVGDFVEGNGDVETAREDWDNILPILERLTLRFPFVYTPGNYDIWNDQTENYWREYTSTEPSRTEEIYGIAFVVWDTSRDDHLSMDDLDTIKSLMEEINTDNPWILVTHKPFWFMSYEDSAVVSDFKKLMTESGPLAVVGGHIHRFAADREDGVLYISAGPSGSAIWEPDPEHGRFTQFGWMTIWPDSAAYAVVDARGIYSETINTGEEMNLFYLYRNEMFAGRQLEMELESAVLTLRPVEDRTRTVRLSIDVGNWNLHPDTLEIELMDDPIELHFTQSPAGSPYPSPVIAVDMEYGSRNRELSFEYHWPVLRTANAFITEPVLDGTASPGEYRGILQTNFANPEGQPSNLPETGFIVANDTENLFICTEMQVSSSESEDYAGFIFSSGDSFYWLRVWRDGTTEALIIPPEGEWEDWEEGYSIVIETDGTDWCLEAAFDISLLDPEEDFVGLHLYRVVDDDYATWVYPIEFDASTMGRIWLE